MQIGHSVFWMHEDDADMSPPVGTVIPLPLSEDSEWIPKVTEPDKEILEADPSHCLIHREHCLIGSQGSAVVGCISQAIHSWMALQSKDVHFLPISSTITHNSSSPWDWSFLNAPSSPGKPVHAPVNSSGLSAGPTADVEKVKVLICGHAVLHCRPYSIGEMLKSSGFPYKEEADVALLVDAIGVDPF